MVTAQLSALLFLHRQKQVFHDTALEFCAAVLHKDTDRLANNEDTVQIASLGTVCTGFGLLA